MARATTSPLSYRRTDVTGDHGPKASVVGLEAAVEALCQAVLWVEINGAYKGGRSIGLRLQHVREVKQRRRQRATDRAHGGALGVGSREDGRVRNHAAGRLGVGMLEDDALPGETIEVGGESAFGAEKSHPVGAGGVESDQDEVGFGCGCGEGEAKQDQTDAAHDFS